MSAEPLVPGAIELRPERLRLQWPDGAVHELDAAALRAACCCAGCRVATRSGDLVEPDAGVRLTDAVPVGLYALQLRFSDGHERGIYPWALLRALPQLT
ncbi:gamma-butyrobetaine hydroxylase-like domain-containing protein [Azohydromonas caseinilytica]|uniref:DUF971 domain-containing protein n=1 Tax=Azohydromonas caseinilytica TaxID=2728836 RepID=A0A848FHX8_9BURK|nr:gamma-butyrobetaine hydroxylase-like domain-containing protein [Azohydromonas caseinilytica]NML17810.1 DUF971 domain-containing protein [Azohydromonas caseinilytica]